MQKVFSNGNEKDGRYILVSVNKDYIEFFFNQQYNRQLEWISNENERRSQVGEDELTEDEKCNDSFYWMGTEDWVSDKTQRLDRSDNWHKHMARKAWFTKEMADFIHSNT